MNYWHNAYWYACRGYAQRVGEDLTFKHIATPSGELQVHCVDPMTAALRQLTHQAQMLSEGNQTGGVQFDFDPPLDEWKILASGS